MRYSTSLLACFAATALFAREAQPGLRLENATAAMNEIMASPDKGIPRDTLDKARCIVVVPNLKKAAIGVGGEYGRGFASCRTQANWSPPAAMIMEAGTLGVQLGGSESDVVILAMNQRAMNRLVREKFTLGGEASVAAGPVGKDTKVEDKTKAEFLSWSRSRGLFAGISLQGVTLRRDMTEDHKLYGREVTNQEILESATVPVPIIARPFMNTLNRYAGNEAATLEKEGRVTLTEDQIHFATGQYAIPKTAEDTLSRLAASMKDHPGWRIRVEGYTDNVGTKEFNQKLSEKRAMAVINWLADHGIDRSRLSEKAYGESQPVANNSTNSGRALNRRVEIVRS